MGRKLEYYEIAGNLPYLLFGMVDECPYPMLGIEKDTLLVKTILHDNEDYWNLSEFKPILYPIDSLNKTYIHNGKEITPMDELAKIAFNGKATRKLFFESGSFFGERQKSIIADGESNGSVCCDVPNQIKLFDYLNELKLDFRNLIDYGLAISVYDLPKNPYCNE